MLYEVITRELALIALIALQAFCAVYFVSDVIRDALEAGRFEFHLGIEAFANLGLVAGIVDLDTGEVLATERQFLPTTGTATYTGYVGGDVAGDTLIGELSLTANFTGGGTVEGTATNFQHEVDGAYSYNFV